MVTTAEGEAQLQAAVDCIPQGLVVFDPALRLVTCNRRGQQLLNLPEDLAAVGTPLQAIALHLAERGDLGPEDPALLAAQRAEVLTRSETAITQRNGGDGRTLEFHSARRPGGGLVVSIADVSDRVAAEAELERVNASLERRVEERTAALTRVNAELETARAKADAANRDKTRFLAAASHDLLQPLNAARLYTATLIERSGGTALGGLAHSIEASLHAVEEILTALLDISRIDSGALKPTPTAFRVRDLLKKIELEFAPLARERGVELRLVPTSATVQADRAL